MNDIVSDAALISGLATALQLASPEMITSLDREPGRYRSSSELEELRIRLIDGTALSLVFKDYGRPHAVAGKRLRRPEFLFEPRRSIALYENVLSGQWDARTFRGAVVEPEASRYWLFLQRIDGSPLDEVGDWSVWEAAAAWLGGFHGAMKAIAVKPPPSVPLLRYNAHSYRIWMRRAVTFARAWPAARRRRLARLSVCHEAVVERLTAEPLTLIHGDFHASNLLVADNSQAICPVDWELAGIGPGLLDLAALASGNVTDVQRRSLLQSYRAALVHRGEVLPPFPETMASLDYCLLQLAIQWMGWQKHWDPPADQQRDWLVDAEVRAEKLSL